MFSPISNCSQEFKTSKFIQSVPVQLYLKFPPISSSTGPVLIRLVTAHAATCEIKNRNCCCGGCSVQLHLGQSLVPTCCHCPAGTICPWCVWWEQPRTHSHPLCPGMEVVAWLWPGSTSSIQRNHFWFPFSEVWDAQEPELTQHHGA